MRPPRGGWQIAAAMSLGLVVLASEVGVLEIDQSTIIRKGRLEPGKMFLVDTAEGRIIDDAEIKGGLAAEHPYGEWVSAGLVQLDDGHSHEWRPVEVETLLTVVLQQRVQALLLLVWAQSAPVQMPQVERRLGLDHLHRFAQALPYHRCAEHRMPFHKLLPGALERR